MKSIYIAILLLVLISCSKNEKSGNLNESNVLNSENQNNTNEESKSTSKRDVALNVSSDYEVNELSTDMDYTLEMKSNSKLKIWKKTFVYENNTEVNEPIILKYREINSSIDAVYSSISMIYDSSGLSRNFESAGMFEVLAYGKSSGKILKIRKGKQLELEINSSNTENDFNYYKYDTLSNNWTYLSKANSTFTIKKSKSIDLKEPIKPLKPTNNGNAFDLDLDVDKFSELSQYQGIIWEYVPDSKMLNPNKEKWIFQENWTDIQLIESKLMKGCYQVTLKSSKKSFSTIIRPALTGNDYEKAMTKYEKELALYNKKLNQESSQKFNLKISDLGIYNIDRIASIKNPYTLEADFMTDQKVDLSNSVIYLIYNNQKNVITYSKNGLNKWSKFIFDSKIKDNHLLVILPGNKVAIASQEQFNSILVQKHKSFRFQLKVVDKKIEEMNDLSNLFK